MPLKTQQDEPPSLNLTSLIDVVFLLIVFFMAAAKFSDTQRDINLRLPEVAKAGAPHPAPKAREVAVHADGQLTLDRQNVTVAELTAQLTAARKDQPALTVVIHGDAACPFQHIASAMAACKEAGVAELAVSVRIAQAAAPQAR